MTNPLPPRRRIEPLPPPPGQFDAVLNRARARRYHRLSAVAGVATVFVAGIAGGLAMGGSVSGVPNSLYSLATGGGDPASATPPPTESPSAVALPSKGETPVKSHSRPASTTASDSTQRPLRVRGKIVDGHGDPVGGLFVYTGTFTADTFVPTSASAAAITSIRGRYSVPCTGGPVLVTSWTINEPLGTWAEGSWAARLVKNTECAQDAPAKVSVVKEGATVQGRVTTDTGCSTIFPLWLWLNGDRTAAVRLSGLTSGAPFRIDGVPEGTHILGAKGRRTPVTVTGKGIVEQDVEFACPGGPPSGGTTTSDPSPSSTPEATDSPTDEPPSSPSSPTTTPEPSTSSN